MTNCQTIKKNISKICTADFDKRIAIKTSSITGSSSPNVQSSIGFSTVATVWAMIKTTANNEFINGVNVQNGVNTDFYIRYNSTIDITKQLYIEYNSNLFRITSTEDIGKDQDIIRLRATEKGLAATGANQR